MPNPFDEKDAFIRGIYEAYYLKLERMCMRLIDYDGVFRDLVDESLQDAFTAAFKSYDTLRQHPNIEAWLKKVCKNRLVSLAKSLRKQHKRFPSIASMDDRQLGEEPDVSEKVASAMAAKEVIDELLASLSKTEKEIYHSHFIENHTITEIAQSRNCSENNVNVTLAHIRKKAEKAVKKNISNFFIFLLSFWLFDRFI